MLFKHMSLFICMQQNILKLDLGIPPFMELSFELNSMLRSIGISMSPVYQSFRCECQWSIQQRSSKPYWKTLLKFICSWHCIRTRTAYLYFQRWPHHGLRSSHRFIFTISIPRCVFNVSGWTCKSKLRGRRVQSHRWRHRQFFNFLFIFVLRCHKELHLWSRTATTNCLMTFNGTLDMRCRSLHLLNMQSLRSRMVMMMITRTCTMAAGNGPWRWRMPNFSRCRWTIFMSSPSMS